MGELTSTFYLYKYTEDGGIKILRCRSLDSVVVIPDSIAGKPVTELGAYSFSEHMRQLEEGRWTEADSRMDGIPEMMGDKLTGLSLPSRIRKVGAYAFYNCWNLEKLACHSRTLDWGAGAFTGCSGIIELDIQVREEEKSCFKEILTELRQTLFVVYRGRREARLVFPEFYEEAVENTPAKVFKTRMHGCGHQYRYCFRQSEFLFGAYDSLFYHMQVQEPEQLVVKLAANRLRYPYMLSADAEAAYKAYITDHRVAAAVCAVYEDDMDMLRWLMKGHSYKREDMAIVIEAVSKKGDVEMMSYLMDMRDRQYRMDRQENRHTSEMRRKKRFEL